MDLNLVRENERRLIRLDQIPANFEAFKKAVAQRLDNSDKPISVIRFLSNGKDVDKTNYAVITKLDEIEVYFEGEVIKSDSSIALAVNFVPDTKVMTEGGIVEYEFVTAIAELIDNSIEHSLDIDGDRNIVFEINTDVDRKNITVKDNGVGMDRIGVQKWMTLAANTKPRGQSSVYWLKPFHLTAQLSRFGVGAKNAAFYLGNVVTLESKPEGTKVHSVTLDKKTLEDRSAAETRLDKWNADVKTQDTTDTSSWTKVVVHQLRNDFGTLFHEDFSGIRGYLAHIYHYYCYGGDQDAAASPHVFCFANVGDSVVSKSADAFAAVLANYAFEHLHLKKSDYGKLLVIAVDDGLKYLEHLAKEKGGEKKVEQFKQAHICQLKNPDGEVPLRGKLSLDLVLKNLLGDEIRVHVSEGTKAQRLRVASTNVFAQFGLAETSKLGNRVLPIKTPLKYFPDSKVHFNLLGHLTAQKWVHEDREYLYNKRAASIFRFELKLSAPAQTEDQYNGEGGVKPTEVVNMESIFQFRVYYFNQKFDGKTGEFHERNPDLKHPRILTAKEIEDTGRSERDAAALYLEKDRPKVEWFWNGRLIPWADLDLYFLSEPPSGRLGIPRECYTKRIKVAAFVDSTVGVNRSKSHIDKENSTMLNFLLDRPNKRMPGYDNVQKQLQSVEKQFHEWLKHCNSTYDQAFELQGAATEKNGNSYFPSAKVGKEVIKIGSRVVGQFAKGGGPRVYGWVNSIFYAGPYNATQRHQANVAIYKYTLDEPASFDQFEHGDASQVATFGLSNVRPITEDDAWAKVKAQELTKFGSRIVFEEASPTDWGTEGNVTQTCVVCLDVGTIRKPIVSCKQCMTPVHRGCYEAAQGDDWLCQSCLDPMDIENVVTPNRTFRVFHAIKGLLIKLYEDLEGKQLVKNKIPIVLQIKSGERQISTEISKAWKPGQFYPKSVGGFDLPGMYTMTAFVKDRPEVVTDDYLINIVPSYPSTFPPIDIPDKLRSPDPVRIGESFQLRCVCNDIYGVPIFFMIDKAPSIELLAASKEALSALKLQFKLESVKVADDRQSLLISFTVLGKVPDKSVEISFAIGALEQTVDMKIVAGPAHRLLLPKEYQNQPYLNRSILPPLEVKVCDISGNVTSTADKEMRLKISAPFIGGHSTEKPFKLEMVPKNASAMFDFKKAKAAITVTTAFDGGALELPVQVTLLDSRGDPWKNKKNEDVVDELKVKVVPSNQPHDIKFVVPLNPALTVDTGRNGNLRIRAEAGTPVILGFQAFKEDGGLLDGGDLSRGYVELSQAFSNLNKVKFNVMNELAKNTFSNLQLPSETNGFILYFPEFRAQTDLGERIHEVQLFVGETRISKSLFILTTPARPHHLNVKIPDRQKSELKFEAAVHIVDQFNNVVNTGNLGPNDYPPNPTFSVENDTVKLDTTNLKNSQTKEGYNSTGLLLSGLGPCKLKCSLETETYGDLVGIADTIVEAGPPSRLAILGSGLIEGYAGLPLPEIAVQVVDNAGNPANLQGAGAAFTLSIEGECLVSSSNNTIKVNKTGDALLIFKNLQLKPLNDLEPMSVLESNLKIFTSMSKKVPGEFVKLKVKQPGIFKQWRLPEPEVRFRAGSPISCSAFIDSFDGIPINLSSFQSEGKTLPITVTVKPALAVNASALSYDNSTGGVKFTSSQPVTAAGVYEVKFVYEEKRDEWRELGLQPASTTLRVVVEAGEPSQLAFRSGKLFNNAILPFVQPVSNGREARQRELFEKLDILLADEFNNVIPLDFNIKLFAQDELVAAANNPPTAVPPTLLFIGHVAGPTQSGTQGKISINAIVVQEATGKGQAEYVLQWKTALANGKEIRSLPLPVKFDDDQTRQNIEKERVMLMQRQAMLATEDRILKEKLSKIEREYRAKEAAFNEAATRLGVPIDIRATEKISQLQRLISDAEGQVARAREDLNRHRGWRCADNKADYFRRLSEMINRHCNANRNQRFGIAAEVVHAPPNDSFLQKVVTGACSDLNVAIVPDSIAEDLLATSMNDRNVATLNLEGVRPFADRNLPNTADQRIPDDFLLPTRFRGRRDELERIGFLGFLINLIELPPWFTHLRRSAIWALYSRTSVFRDINGAREFRKLIVQAGESCPQIYTRDGFWLKSNGIKVFWDMNRSGPSGFQVGIMPADFTGELHPLLHRVNELNRLNVLATELTALFTEHLQASQEKLQFDASKSAEIALTNEGISRLGAQLVANPTLRLNQVTSATQTGVKRSGDADSDPQSNGDAPAAKKPRKH